MARTTNAWSRSALRKARDHGWKSRARVPSGPCPRCHTHARARVGPSTTAAVHNGDGGGRQMVDANFPLDLEGRTFHLGAKEGEISNRILSVGDASRAELISQQLRPFPDGRPVFNMVSARGFSVTTGMAGGEEVSIVTTLMGMPNMDFVIREARAVIRGPMAVVRLGTCGALQPGTLGKVLVPKDGCMWVYRNPDAFGAEDAAAGAVDPRPYIRSRPVYPHAALCDGLLAGLERELGPSGYKCGINCTTDSFYATQGRITPYFDDRNEELMASVMAEVPNAVSFEMESFQLLHLASCSRGSIAAAACAIGLAERASNEFLTPQQLVDLEKRAGSAALDALVNFDLGTLNG